MSSEKDQKPDAPKSAPASKPAWERAEAYQYVGPGIVPGVPNRDLDAFDVKGLPIDLLREVAHSDFYTGMTAKELADKQEAAAEGSK